MTDKPLTVANDIVVTLEYTLRLDDGDVVSTSEDGGPLEFVQGRGEIIPGLEQALYGMAMGEEKDVTVPPLDGYGTRNPDALQTFPRDAFPPDVALEPGTGLRMRDPSGRVVVAYVWEVLPDGVVLDFNHPLAGETLHFHVKIADMREATSEELAPACATGCAGCGPGGCH